MSEEHRWSEPDSENSWSFEIDDSDSFLELLNTVGGDENLTWFSVCSGGIVRSDLVNQTFESQKINHAKNIGSRPFRRGMPITNVVPVGIKDKGVVLEKVDKPVHRLISFMSEKDFLDLSKEVIDKKVNELVGAGGDTDFIVYHVILSEGVVRRVVDEWKQKRLEGKKNEQK